MMTPFLHHLFFYFALSPSSILNLFSCAYFVCKVTTLNKLCIILTFSLSYFPDYFFHHLKGSLQYSHSSLPTYFVSSNKNDAKQHLSIIIPSLGCDSFLSSLLRPTVSMACVMTHAQRGEAPCIILYSASSLTFFLIPPPLFILSLSHSPFLPTGHSQVPFVFFS